MVKKVHTEIDTEKSEDTGTKDEEEILPPNIEGEESTLDATSHWFINAWFINDRVKRFVLLRPLAVLVLYVSLGVILLFAPFVAVAISAAGSSYCPLDPVISYPCCEPSLIDFFTTFSLFAGMLLPCSFFLHLVSQRWMDKKFQREGERIKGIVSDKHTWRTSHAKGTSCHCELIVKYPAEGTTLVSTNCSRIVTKKFANNTGFFDGTDYASYNQMSIGSEIELIRMAASDGYDPRKAIPVLSITSDRVFHCQLYACLLFGIVWNSFWSSISCIALFWSWPIAILISYLTAGDNCFGCCRDMKFKKNGLEGETLNRYDLGKDTTSESDNDVPSAAHKKEFSIFEGNVDSCSLDCGNRTIV